MNSSMSTDEPRGRVCFLSLGCPKNLVDGEELMARAEQQGYALVPEPDEADIVVINTCAFIADAERESIDEILAIAQMKSAGWRGRLLVAGCLAERHGADLLREIPEIDGLLGPGDLAAIGRLLDDLSRGTRGVIQTGHFTSLDSEPPRVRVGSPHSAYVKISEGCDHRCSFCLIPKLRGPQRSRDVAGIVSEVTNLAAEGVREVVLVAQDTTAYGSDLPGAPTLATLLRELLRTEGPEWIRVLYTHPGHWSEELIEVFAAGGRLLPYVDLPIQHISDPVLRAMGRRHGGADLRALLDTLRRRIARLVLRTTVMTGHPGEGAAEFAELLQLLEEFPFDRLGAFAYSREDGTRAAALEACVSPAEADARREQILELQKRVSGSLQRARVGSELDLLIEGIEVDRGFAVGRTYGEAPEIDGIVYLKAADRVKAGLLEPGDFVPVRIRGAGPYDLVAIPRV